MYQPNYSIYSPPEGSLMAGGSGVPASASSSGMSMAHLGPILGALGAIQGGIGSYYSMQSSINNLRFQSYMAEINARMTALNVKAAERSAQSIMQAGEQAIGQTTLKAGKVKSAQKVSQASRGISMGEGNAAEEIATTDLMKETDALTIDANRVRQAAAARMQGVSAGMQVVNEQNESMLKSATANSANPYAAAASSLLSSGASVASSWYTAHRQDRLAEALGVI